MTSGDRSDSWQRGSAQVLLLALISYAAELLASPPIYRITEIGDHNGEQVVGIAINSSGHVAGLAGLNTQGRRAIFWDGATVTDLGTLGGSSSQAIDINDSGHVIGRSTIAGDSATHSFLWDGEFMEDLNPMVGTEIYALDITNSGHVLLRSDIPADIDSLRTFVWNGVTMADIGSLDGMPTAAGQAINESGWVAGTSGDRAFLYNGQFMQDLGTLGGSFSSAWLINSVGNVVGISPTPGDMAYHLFLWDGAVMRDLGTFGRDDIPQGSSITPQAMNDAGQITGTVHLDVDEPSTQSERAFLWDGNELLNLGFLGQGPSLQSSNGHAIDAHGNVAGTSASSTLGRRAFLWHEQRMYDLNDLVHPSDPLGEFVLLQDAHDFNDAGQLLVSGTDSRHGGRHFVLTPVPNPNEVTTPADGNVTVKPVLVLPDSTSITTVTVEFEDVDVAGTTTVTASSTPVGGASPSPGAFEVGNPPVYYDVATTAGFTGPVSLCFSWEESQFEDEETVGVFHFEDGIWQNVTTILDTEQNRVCGEVASLSPFALFEAAEYQFAGFSPPVDNPPTRNVVKAGAAVPVKFSLGAHFGLGVLAAGFPQSQQVPCDNSTPTRPDTRV